MISTYRCMLYESCMISTRGRMCMPQKLKINSSPCFYSQVEKCQKRKKMPSIFLPILCLTWGTSWLSPCKILTWSYRDGNAKWDRYNMHYFPFFKINALLAMVLALGYVMASKICGTNDNIEEKKWKTWPYDIDT